METQLEYLQNHIVSTITKQINDVVIEGLNRKGFTFENDKEISDFITKNCRCDEFQNENRRVYYVNDIPFLEWYYKIENNIESNLGNVTKFTANYGEYRFL